MTSHQAKSPGQSPSKEVPGDNVSTLSAATSETSITNSETITGDKYQRLATEYAKLRNKLNILKKAYIEEQSKVSKLEEVLKLGDQSSRKQDQEIESLLFRNQQLSKRISVLQAELEAGHNKHASTASSLFTSVVTARKRTNSTSMVDGQSELSQALFQELNSELKAKTEEKECLADIVKSLESARELVQAENERRLATVEAEAEQVVARFAHELKQAQTMLDEVNSERHRLESELGATRTQLDMATKQLEELRGERQQLKDKLSQHELLLLRPGDAAAAAAAGQAVNGTQNKTKVKVKVGHQRGLTDNDLDILVNKVVTFISALSTLHSNVAQKVASLADSFSQEGADEDLSCLYFFDLSAGDAPIKSSEVEKLLGKLKELTRSYSVYLGPIEKATKTWATTGHKDDRVEASEALALFTEYVSYLSTLNACLTLCFNTWCRTLLETVSANKSKACQVVVDRLEQDQSDAERRMVQSKRRRLAERNELLAHVVARSVRVLFDLANYSQLLISKLLLNSNVIVVVDQMLARLVALDNCIQEMKRVLSSKVVLEHDLGLTRSAHLRSLDDGILASLVYLGNCAEGIRHAWREHAACLAPTNDQSGQSLSSLEETLDSADDDVFDGLVDTEKKEVVVLEDKDEEQEEREKSPKKSPAKQPDNLNQETEKDKDTEIEDESVSVDRPTPLALHKSTTAASLSSGSVEANFAELCSLSSPTLADYSPPSMLVDGKMIGHLTTTTTTPSTNDDPKAQRQAPPADASNAALVTKLVNSLQLADGRAAAYQRECESLQQRLRLIIDQREWAERRLSEAETSQKSRQDEYHTSVANYMTQLSTMSEHMASLNERLAAQQEEIDILNYERRMAEKRPEETMDIGGGGGGGVGAPLQSNGSSKEGTVGANTVANRAKSLGKKLSFKRT